jgi:hypothetical protein
MRTSSGQVINLTPSLCSSKATPIALPVTATATATTPQTRPAIEFAAFRVSVDKYGLGRANGQITNRGQQQVAVKFINFVQEGGNIVQVQTNAIVKPGATVQVKDASVKGNLTPDAFLSLADAESWADTTGEGQTSGFAACEFASNVNEAEKRCNYH